MKLLKIRRKNNLQNNSTLKEGISEIEEIQGILEGRNSSSRFKIITNKENFQITNPKIKILNQNDLSENQIIETILRVKSQHRTINLKQLLEFLDFIKM